MPARVYWVRRLMVLGIALLLVVGIAKLLGGGSGGGDTATKVDQTTSPSSTPPAPRHHHRKSTPSATPVVTPSGPCTASDVAITPSVPSPVAGRDIKLVLDVTSLSIPACTWTLSKASLAMKITSGTDLIWTTTQCAASIPTRNLVLQQGKSTRVELTWNARRSEPGCPVQTAWAMPGTYHLHVAALAGPPQDVTFLLTAPSPAQVTKTAHPHQTHKKHKKRFSTPPG